jgi:hypothetical protein
MMKAQDAQRAHLRTQLRGLLRELEEGRLDGARVFVERSQVGRGRALHRVRGEEEEELVRCALRLLAACPGATRLDDLVEPVRDLCMALGITRPSEAAEILRAWSHERPTRRR